MTVIYPGADWRPCTNQSGPMSAHLGLILHVQEGDNDLAAEFNNPASQASYTWVVLKDGAVQQYVDGDMTAWAQAQGNGTYNSCGTQGFSTELLTDQACQAIAGLYRFGHDTYGWPYQLAENPGEPGFGWHGMGGQAWGGHESCPGDLRKAQRQHILDLAQGAPAPAPTIPQEDDMPTLVVRRAVMNPDGSGDGYTLDAHGGIWPVGNAIDVKQATPPPPYWPDAGAAVDFGVTDWDRPAGWTLDAKGAVHGWGGFVAHPGKGYWPNAFVPPAPQV